MAGLAILGIADQTPTRGSPNACSTCMAVDSRHPGGSKFFEAIEDSMPEGARSHLPVHPVPEERQLNDMNTYEHARGYLHTNTLVWSYAT